ncbi:MAG TPA: phosphatidate cytidylyltransferase [Rhodopila sp.]|nr:phosphatidate cytidylyltransferase [Rhodopila sp.]
MGAEPAGAPKSRVKSKWSDLRPRVLSALILVPVVLIALWIGGYTFAVLVALAAAGMAYEWLGLCRARDNLPAVLPFTTLPAAVLLVSWGAVAAAFLLLAGAMLVSAFVAGGLTRHRPVPFGIIYIGLGTLALMWLRQSPAAGLANVIGLLLVVWASDIGAYAVGRAVGGPLLAPAISPGKTWSGAVGGLVATAVTGACAALVLGGSGTAVWRSVGIAMLIGVVAQLGDLFESRLKRHFGVKDSGGLIPGHGGLLDRLDALLAAAPVAALLALALGRGVILWK